MKGEIAGIIAGASENGCLDRASPSLARVRLLQRALAGKGLP